MRVECWSTRRAAAGVENKARLTWPAVASPPPAPASFQTDEQRSGRHRYDEIGFQMRLSEKTIYGMKSRGAAGRQAHEQQRGSRLEGRGGKEGGADIKRLALLPL